MNSKRKISRISALVLFPILAVLAFVLYQRSSSFGKELEAVAVSGVTAELCEINGKIVSGQCLVINIEDLKGYVSSGRMSLTPSKAEIANEYMLLVHDQQKNTSCYRVIRYVNNSLPLMINEIDSSGVCTKIDNYGSSYFRIANFFESGD